MSFEFTLYDALVSIDVPADKARAVIDALEHDMGSTLATKQDLDHLKELFTRDIERLNERVGARHGAVAVVDDGPSRIDSSCCGRPSLRGAETYLTDAGDSAESCFRCDGHVPPSLERLISASMASPNPAQCASHRRAATPTPPTAPATVAGHRRAMRCRA